MVTRLLRPPRQFTARLVLLISLLFAIAGFSHARELTSYAFVNDDGTLRIKQKTVHLHGIFIPETSRTCRTTQRPMVCGSRAALALDFKIQGFVRCDILRDKPDRSLVGLCRVNYSQFDEGEDLSAYLLKHGWAVALPDAPFEYQAMERIARSRGQGLWGFPIDSPAFRQLKQRPSDQ